MTLVAVPYFIVPFAALSMAISSFTEPALLSGPTVSTKVLSVSVATVCRSRIGS